MPIQSHIHIHELCNKTNKKWPGNGPDHLTINKKLLTAQHFPHAMFHHRDHDVVGPLMILCRIGDLGIGERIKIVQAFHALKECLMSQIRARHLERPDQRVSSRV